MYFVCVCVCYDPSATSDCSLRGSSNISHFTLSPNSGRADVTKACFCIRLVDVLSSMHPRPIGEENIVTQWRRTSILWTLCKRSLWLKCLNEKTSVGLKIFLSPKYSPSAPWIYEKRMHSLLWLVYHLNLCDLYYNFHFTFVLIKLWEKREISISSFTVGIAGNTVTRRNGRFRPCWELERLFSCKIRASKWWNSA